MNRLLRRFSSSINNKLILLSVIPVTLVTLIITLHTIDSRRTEIQQFHTSNAQRLAKNLATISDFAIYSGNQEMLRSLSSAARDIPSISDVYFLDANRETLLPLNGTDKISAEMLKTGFYLGLDDRFLAVEEPAYLKQLEVNDYEDESSQVESESPVVLGWVVVVANNSEALEKSKEILITHLLISFIVLLGAIILSFVLSNHVVSPVRAMINAVRELERGNYKTRIEPTTGDELAILANGINHLARAVAEGREDLESKVELATFQLKEALADLTRKNNELDEARKTAEAASTAKGDFLAQMSHELRTPITAIQGFVRLLESSGLNASEQRYCMIIQQASDQLLQLIDDILDITKLQSSAIRLESTDFNLADCIEAPIALMAATAHNKEVELILDLAPNVPLELVGDSLRIRQIVYNLVSNAIKFTPAGHVSVKVRSSTPKNGELTLLFQVLDTGIGIPDHQQARLFEAFSQADTSISRRFGGSGLGLSIVKQLVTLMGGTISLESTTGKGSSFVIRLPLRLQSGAQTATTAINKCVLLFDSQPQSRQALENHLGRFVEIIESCESISDLSISTPLTPPEIIIYAPRVNQPVADVEKELEALSQVPDCPIVILTPTSPQFKDIPEEFCCRFSNLSFHSKPPGTKELEGLLKQQEATENEKNLAIDTIQATILIAEDNEFTRLLLDTFFANRGCQLRLTSNGQEAIAQAQKERFDLILLDVHMPGVNGITALQAIREQSGPNRETPVIMLTADILQQEENTLFELGASDLVFKPFDENRLLSAVRKHLRTPIADGVPEEKKDHREQQRLLFAEEIKKLTELARNCLFDGDGDNLRDAIHQLLGIAGVYRMEYLERAVRALHSAVKVGDGNKMFAAMETLSLEVEKLSDENPA